ncbi:FAD-dependent oxidoreductase [Sinimarinibacterium flocculans]|uniref:Ferredoxin--NADP+ reductase n=1 Tax=Sinimarinibacterium flocculans TaxID=985250 RepID=A0A318EA43_9GAMM|nr:FAD-dependent oxidoreductase [Sinimarinibacterium flocculans]PXV69433.1 ferredoxin--NADP+ reductase [Sinimarinibacterium flocculans]
MSAAPRRLDVAIVGAGPSALYTAAALARLDDPQVHVNLIERLPVIGGLARSGVAPDHWTRRQVIDAYETLARSSGRLQFFGNVDVGRDITIADLLAHHHAVIHAVGASGSQPLGIPGEDLDGCHASSRFVGWYNGHPDDADLEVRLDHERAVVVGNGNVALDIARILLRADADWDRSDIAPHARAALADSRIREVCVLGRRGPGQAAFTNPELLELAALPDVHLDVDAAELTDAPWTDTGFAATLRRRTLEACARAPATPDRKRLRLRFCVSPVEILGQTRVEGVRLVRNRLAVTDDGRVRAEPLGETEDLPAGLVVHAVGYRAQPPAGLPFDAQAGVVPQWEGRVLRSAHGEVMAGHYVVGWIKRGPRGVIGSNKSCAAQTVRALLDDFAAGRLAAPERPAASFEAFVQSRQPERVCYRGWRAIDRHERAQAQAAQPRRKLSRVDEMLRVARM